MHTIWILIAFFSMKTAGAKIYTAVNFYLKNSGYCEVLDKANLQKIPPKGDETKLSGAQFKFYDALREETCKASHLANAVKSSGWKMLCNDAKTEFRSDCLVQVADKIHTKTPMSQEFSAFYLKIHVDLFVSETDEAKSPEAKAQAKLRLLRGLTEQKKILLSRAKPKDLIGTVDQVIEAEDQKQGTGVCEKMKKIALKISNSLSKEKGIFLDEVESHKKGFENLDCKLN